MTIKTAISITAVAATTLLTSSVSAEPFNRRGALWTEVAPAGSTASRPTAKPDLTGFIERGEHWPSTAPRGSLKPRQPVQPDPEGFNRRSRFPRDYR